MPESSLISSSSRPLRVRIRKDLIFVRQTWQGRDYWIIKDPLTLRFFRFEEEEFSLLRLLDGTRSADEIRRAFHSRFAPQKISNRELFQFIGSLFRSSLIVSDASGQATQLRQRGIENRRREWRGKLSNVLALRLRGFDPDGILTLLNRYFGWVFHPACVALTCLFILAAVGLIASNFEQFQSRLPQFQEFFSSSNWLWLGVILALTKVLHELGHGLACKRFGSQCHSMGIMFLVLMPCLYCDVSDSWTLRSKWRRAAIAAAGMYFEFILASVCAFVWWFSEPGWINMLALNVVFVCSVSTLLFNANPLLKFDGYYILSDLIEVPNLRAKASSVLRRFGAQWFLGIEPRYDPFMPVRKRWLFGLYAILAFVYRWFITLSIFWFLYNLLEPYGLKLIGQAIALVALWGLLGMPLLHLYRFLSVPGRISTVNRLRFSISGMLAIVILGGILLIPVPHYVRCSFIVQHQDVQTVYVDMPGTVAAIHANESQWVDEGQPLITLSNPELLEGILTLQGEEQVARQRYYSTRQQAHYDEAAEADVNAQLASWQAATRQLEQRRQDVGRLQILSPVRGNVLSASYIAPAVETQGTLQSWHGHPMELRNRGAWLDEGTVVCRVAPESGTQEAILAIDQADIEFITSGNPVELWFNQRPGKSTHSLIDRISLTEMEQVPKALDSRFGGSLLTTAGADGETRPHSTTYQVRVKLPDTIDELSTGATGSARIRTGNQTIGSRIWRFACKTFRFDL